MNINAVARSLIIGGGGVDPNPGWIGFSSYKSTQDSTNTWTTMKMASGVTGVAIRLPTFLVLFGYGNTPEESQASKFAVGVGKIVIESVSGSYISWFSSAPATFEIEQGKN